MQNIFVHAFLSWISLRWGHWTESKHKVTSMICSDLNTNVEKTSNFVLAYNLACGIFSLKDVRHFRIVKREEYSYSKFTPRSFMFPMPMVSISTEATFASISRPLHSLTSTEALIILIVRWCVISISTFINLGIWMDLDGLRDLTSTCWILMVVEPALHDFEPVSVGKN